MLGVRVCVCTWTYYAFIYIAANWCLLIICILFCFFTSTSWQIDHDQNTVIYSIMPLLYSCLNLSWFVSEKTFYLCGDNTTNWFCGAQYQPIEDCNTECDKGIFYCVHLNSIKGLVTMFPSTQTEHLTVKAQLTSLRAAYVCPYAYS